MSLRSCSRSLAPLVLGLVLGAHSLCSAADSWTLSNPTGISYEQEPVQVPLAPPAGDFAVQVDGQAVPHMLLARPGGTTELWIAASPPADSRQQVTLVPGQASSFEALVTVTEVDGQWQLDNGLLAVRVPKDPSALVAPITAIKPADQANWSGQGAWQTAGELAGVDSQLIGDGVVFAAVHYRYRFAEERYAEITVALWPGHRHVTISESFAMGRDDAWSFDIAAGFAGRQVRVVPYGMGFGQWKQWIERAPEGTSFPPTSLAYGQTRMRDTLLQLLPRWNQAYDDGWFAGLSDGSTTLGAMPARAGRWQWPHDCRVAVKVAESGEVCALTCPTWRGARHWFLLAGPASIWHKEGKQDGAKDYARRHAFLPLDKLANDFILDWPAADDQAGNKKAKPLRFASRDLWSDVAINPTGMLRGQGRTAIREAGKPGGFDKLTHAQYMLHPDTYGSYWLGWSPENPNFFSDFIKIPIAEITRLKNHPRFGELRSLAEQALRTDLYHSVTLPGGAGQECPGYLFHALHQWEALAPVCKQHLGFDPTTWPRYRAAKEFLVHLSQPAGSRRLCHPGGDTHPGKPDPAEYMKSKGVAIDVASLQTEELPGFGVVFRNNPATGKETYLAFKAGPNRGHFHGDQLSFHWCTGARAVAVDHHCSYGPRAGQEHMHNRVAFHTEAMPYANMDGFERLIAFKTGKQVAAAIAQVESDRLRVTEAVPPELWDWEYPQQRFAERLRYRRSIVQLNDVGGTMDCFVIRDQYQGPELTATWCLHGYGNDIKQEGRWFHYDAFSVYVAAPAEFAAGRHDWEHSNGGLEQTKGLRLSSSGRSVEFITVLVPRPPHTVTLWQVDLPNGAVNIPKKGKGAPKPVDARAWISLDADGAPDQAELLIPALMKKPVTAKLERRDDGVFLSAEIGAGRRSKGGSFSVELELGEAGPGRFRSRFAEVEAEGAAVGVLQKDAAALQPRADASWTPPTVTAAGHQISVGDFIVTFAGGLDEEAVNPISVGRANSNELDLVVFDGEVDLDRSQGEVGLFVPDAGYPFGDIPQWLIEQRSVRPAWFQGVWPLRNTEETDR